MMRWLILIASFCVWLTCMTVVYIQYSPHESKGGATPGTEASLNAIFDEQAQPIHAWRIFIDLQRLKSAAADPDNTGAATPGETHAAWNGVNELGLLKVGEFEDLLKRKHESRVEQTTTMNIKIPKETGVQWLEIIEKIQYKSWADVGIERGLETFNSTFKIRVNTPSGVMDLEANSMGSRESDAFSVTQVVFQGGKPLFQHIERIPVEGKAAPTISLIPFQDNPNIKDGYTFEISMLDMSMDIKKEAKPKMVPMKITCSGPKKIRHNGADVPVFEARSTDGTARAWYSADGVVVKQSYLIAGVLEVMLVKIDPKELRHRD